MEKIAECECGNLSISVDGDPYVLICGCDSCQRRTGSAFGMSAYYNKSDVLSTRGPSSQYTRDSQFAKKITFSFCPNCGTSLFWSLESRPDSIGVAVGCFVGQDFALPRSAHHLADMPEWLVLSEDIRIR
ncbi:MAG: aldehyde-activating protein [Candidatus Latescibacteria bacterium]|nr:aldehyde-activating protein [Candidatus Latescibacterota bacterium]